MAQLSVSDDVVESWKKEQLNLRKRLITEDGISWKTAEEDYSGLKLIGGLDISFPKDDLTHACPCFVVLSFPDLKVLYKDLSFVHLTAPFVTEFLAFREVDFFVECIARLMKKSPDLLPQLIIVDGNGLLHSRGFGIACHLGVLTDIPTIGVAKNLFHHDGIEKGELHRQQALRSSNPTFSNQDCKPIYISIGHRISLETAVYIVDKCCINRIPEPTRQADILSREFLRKHYTDELRKCQCYNES